ncbi:hypothetical protein DID88_008278 [Monilinia fructigena]|uniref:Uncharacterized protein n=1 Tax=Monilinia fructigena TaxID=38457 RepID=A0A395J797_9HELO|nr:hypothetical protein DID88_008278 [Monilinia fructigena]
MSSISSEELQKTRPSKEGNGKREASNASPERLESTSSPIVLEYAIGKVHTTFQKMIHIYEPAMLIGEPEDEV